MNKKKWLYLLCGLLLAALLCMILSNLIQTDFGKVSITTASFETNGGQVTYKLYRPDSATAEHPAPAALLLHGYQNDKDTCDAYCIELARRGVVVMAIDEYGHGETSIGMRERGYVNHKVTTTFGLDSEADGTYVSVGGAIRYRVMMNFSNLSFFDPHYSKDDAGNSIKDSSMGGIAAYSLLGSFDFVDDTRMGVSGHSMGTWSSWSVAAAYSGATNAAGQDISPKAVVLQCGELFMDSVYDSANIHFNNVLELTAKYDEFSYFRDYKNTVSNDLVESPLREQFLGTSEGKWNTTFGNFGDGSARRCELILTNHRLTTHNTHALTTAMEWFDEALNIGTTLAPGSHVYKIKDLLVLIAMFLCIGSMLPLLELLLLSGFFKKLAVAFPDRPYRIKTGGKYWKGAIITVLIAAFTYPFMTQLGHGLLPLPENIFRMTIGNGFLSWYLLLIVIMLITTMIPYRKSRKTDHSMDYMDLGLAETEGTKGPSWMLCLRGFLAALCMTGLLYVLNLIFTGLFGLDLRYIWPFFRPFSLERLGQFCIYLPVFALFFVLNNSKIFAQMRQPATTEKGFKAFLSCWYKNAICMVGGILVLMLIEYIPFFAGIGPGADLLFGSTFGGPFMSLMIVFVPQVLVFSLLCTYTHRRTGNVYTGAFTAAILACWIVTGGSAIL